MLGVGAGVYTRKHSIYGPQVTKLRDKFPLLFENVVLGSLKSSMDHQVDKSLNLTEATAICYSRELVLLVR